MRARPTVIFLFTMTLACAGAPSGPRCAYPHHEVAFVDSGTKGPFQDAAYQDRPLTPHTSICSDSRIVRAANGRESVDDVLILRGLGGNVLPPFRCKDLLHCRGAIQLDDILAEVRKQLEGKSLWTSLGDLLRRKVAQTSTIPRLVGAAPAGQTSHLDDDAPLPRLGNVVITAGDSVTPDLIVPGSASQPPALDLCLHADRTDCGATLPKPVPLPFRNLPAGLHVAWIARPLKGDTVPLRIEDTAVYIIAAHASWTAADLEEARAVCSALALDRQRNPAERWAAVAALAERLAQPK